MSDPMSAAEAAPQRYDRHHPFWGSLLERSLLCGPHVAKKSYHLSLDLSGSYIEYEVGDCIAVLPQNDSLLVEELLERLAATGDEWVQLGASQGGELLRLREALQWKINLLTISKKLVECIARARESQPLLALLDPSRRSELKALIEEEKIADFLLQWGGSQGIELQQIIDAMQPLLPRFYSIASHQPTVGQQVDLLVAYTRYEMGGKPRWGVASHDLCQLIQEKGPVPFYLHPHKGFTLPDEPEADVLMIGPGTGVAPFRGFMQKRLFEGHTGRSWLFFGEWHEQGSFFYEAFWKELVSAGKLRLDTAFSRDQPNKIYVQDRLWEARQEVWDWIQKGGYLFVCGDAQHMARDVEATLVRLFGSFGAMSEREGQAFLRHLAKEGRYRRDVY